MAPMVVAANSRGRYPRLPAEQRVNSEFMLGPRAAVARIPHQVQNGCRRCNAHLACWSRPAATVANADGAEGRVKWEGSKRLRSRAACPRVRSPVAASDGRGSSPRERRDPRGAVGGVELPTPLRRAIMGRSSRRAIARRPKTSQTAEQSTRKGSLESHLPMASHAANRTPWSSRNSPTNLNA